MWHDSFHIATNPAKLQSQLYKIRNFAFFLIPIMVISQKCIIFAADLKNDTKLQHFFLNTQIYENKNYLSCKISNLHKIKCHF